MQLDRVNSPASSPVSGARSVTANKQLKRKHSSDEAESGPEVNGASQIKQENIKSEYETGRVTCEHCRQGVSFRDDNTGGFTLKHWDAHRLTCPAQSGPETVIYTPESTAEALANPPAKRRRAKRTEEERIDYLRTDPYVAQFEAYRVLCASCDKWIRLRPNSTYCSIPWDAHRKSCLAKKIGNKNPEPEIRKYDLHRVLCKTCDKYLSINSNDHAEAMQKWLQHRSTCQKASNAVRPSDSEQASSKQTRTPVNVPPPSPTHLALASATSHVPIPSPDRSCEAKAPIGQLSLKLPPPTYLHTSQSSSPPAQYLQRDLNPLNFQPAHESRRRNAEQRAATLRSDPLIGHVEPNRVFCSLCQKWVQLRQDSSYCAYPWLQHRGKCLARHQRRVQRAAEVEAMKAMAHDGMHEDELMTEDGALSEDPESEEGVDSIDDAALVAYRERAHELPQLIKVENKLHPDPAMAVAAEKHNGHVWVHLNQPWHEHDDEDGDPECDSHPPVAKHAYGTTRRTRPVGLADLDSPSGRRHFIASSIEHLFRTTYEVTDDMTISALLTYLNAAVPTDKFEDFDTSEVTKAVAFFHSGGRLIFEGDTIRRIDG